MSEKKKKDSETDLFAALRVLGDEKLTKLVEDVLHQKYSEGYDDGREDGISTMEDVLNDKPD